MSKLFFEAALLADGWASDVLVEIGADGRFSTVTAGAAPGEALRHGIAVPGMANLHGHAFQRGMAGLAEVAGAGEDSFWTWREVMYRFLERLGPEDVEAIAALAYVEMLESGFTAAAEFHYLHHAPDGRAYANPAELSLRVIAAADATGIALTHLPVLYAQSDFGGAAPASGQCRFVHDLDGFRHLVEALDRQLPRSDVFRLGIAPHSLRAVTPESLVALVQAFPAGPVHIHVAEQEREVEACLAWSGCRPVEWLLDAVPVDERWCLVHCTHMTEAETKGVARSGAVAGFCPITEANLGDGIAPAAALLAAGGRFGIGSDSHVRIDLAEELRLLEYSQRLRDRRRNRLAAQGGSTGGRLFGAALGGGAQALAQPMGAIASGLRADLVVLDAEHPAICGRRGDAILDGWIFSGGTGCVREVCVAGRCLVEGGRHVAGEPIRRRFKERLRPLLGT